MSDVSTPACTNGSWPPLRPVSVAQKNKSATVLTSTVHSIDLPMDCTSRRFWTMRQSNGCSTPDPRSSAAKQWLEELTQKMKKIMLNVVGCSVALSFCVTEGFASVASACLRSGASHDHPGIHRLSISMCLCK